MDVAPISLVVAAISLAVVCCSLAVAEIWASEAPTWMPELLNLADQGRKLVGHPIDGPAQLPELVAPVHALGEVALTHGVQHADEPVHRTRDGLQEIGAARQRKQHGDREAYDDCRLRRADRCQYRLSGIVRLDAMHIDHRL